MGNVISKTHPSSWSGTAPASLGQYLFLGMFTDHCESKRQQHAVAGTGEVQDPLGHHKAHSEEQVTCRKKRYNEESQAQREDPGRWEEVKMATFRLLKKNILFYMKSTIKMPLPFPHPLFFSCQQLRGGISREGLTEYHQDKTEKSY